MYLPKEKDLSEFYLKLQRNIKEMGSVLVAYSGGIDSTLVLKVAFTVLGNRAAGVTALSPAYAKSELDKTISLAKTMGVSHFLIQTDQLQDNAYTQNDHNRCYFCKHELYEQVTKIAKEKGYQFVANGTNVDDLDDVRPGLKAASKFRVRSPLLDVQMTKPDIRRLSQWLSLPNWDKPADACLASRIPYGVTVTSGRLHQIESAEALLQREGFQQFRARYHGDLIRIEVAQEEMSRWSDSSLRLRLSKGLREVGFTYITIDLEGYRKGRMNEEK